MRKTKSSNPKKPQTIFEVVPLAEVLRLTEVAKNLRVLADDAQDDADDAQDTADSANRRASKAQRKADTASQRRKKA